MLKKSERKTIVANWLQSYTIELTTADIKNIDVIQEHYPKGTTAFIAHIRDKSVDELFLLAKKLKEIGLNPVPHLSARNIKDQKALAHFLEKAQEHNITEILALGGGINPPCGDFSSVEQMLQTGLFPQFNIKTLGIAGHPEEHPDVSTAILDQALVNKQRLLQEQNLESYIITQFTFDIKPFLEYLQKLRELDIQIPVRVGIAGVTALKALIKYAAFCGVGNSLQVLKSKSASMKTLLMGYQPDSFFNPLLNQMTKEDECMIIGIHFYLFGNIKKTAEFCNSFLSQ